MLAPLAGVCGKTPEFFRRALGAFLGLAVFSATGGQGMPCPWYGTTPVKSPHNLIWFPSFSDESGRMVERGLFDDESLWYPWIRRKQTPRADMAVLRREVTHSTNLDRERWAPLPHRGIACPPSRAWINHPPRFIKSIFLKAFLINRRP